ETEGVDPALDAEGAAQDALVVDVQALLVQEENIDREIPLHQRQPRQAQADGIGRIAAAGRQPVLPGGEGEDLDLVDAVDPDPHVETEPAVLRLPVDLELPG